MIHEGPAAIAIGARLREWSRTLRHAVQACPTTVVPEPMRVIAIAPAPATATAGSVHVTEIPVADLTGTPYAPDPPSPDPAEPQVRESPPVTAPREPAAGSPDAALCYVYGIVPACTRLPAGLVGAGGGPVRLIRRRGLAGVVSEVPATGVLGTRDDLLAHEAVVAALAARTTMLPLRFSAMVTTAVDVAEKMIEPHHEWFTRILADLDGRAEFCVSGTYVQDTVLREVLAEEPEVMRLREILREISDDTGYNERVRLGELIVHALDAKREVDTKDLMHALSRHAVEVAPRPPADEDTAADAAFLVGDDDLAAFRRAVDELSYRWAGRIKLRVLGPLAPYDFVPSPPGGPYC